MTIQREAPPGHHRQTDRMLPGHMKPEPVHQDVYQHAHQQQMYPPGSRMPAPTANAAKVSNQQLNENKVKSSNTPSPSKESDIDATSANGNFGWATIDTVNIPTLLRNKDTFVSVRIVEMKLLSQFPNTFPEELGKHSPLVSYRITYHEQKLLNEINIQHCSCLYGEALFTEKDLIVKLEEFEKFYYLVKQTFPEEVMNSRSLEIAIPPPAEIREQEFGWIQINNTLSPYIRHDGKKFVMLPVIKHAAALMKDIDVPVMLPSLQECTTINQMCKDAGLDFQFGRSSKLVDIDIVRKHHRVTLLELPLEKPLKHAKYNVSLESLQKDSVPQQPKDASQKVQQQELQPQQRLQQSALQPQPMPPLPQQPSLQHQLMPHQSPTHHQPVAQQSPPQRQPVRHQSPTHQQPRLQQSPTHQQPGLQQPHLQMSHHPPTNQQPRFPQTNSGQSSHINNNQMMPPKSYNMLPHQAVNTQMIMNPHQPPHQTPVSGMQQKSPPQYSQLMQHRQQNQLQRLPVQYAASGLPPGVRASPHQQPYGSQYMVGIPGLTQPRIGTGLPPNLFMNPNNPRNMGLNAIAQKQAFAASTMPLGPRDQLDFTQGPLQLAGMNTAAHLSLPSALPQYTSTPTNGPSNPLSNLMSMGSFYPLSNQTNATCPTANHTNVSQSSPVSTLASSNLAMLNAAHYQNASNSALALNKLAQSASLDKGTTNQMLDSSTFLPTPGLHEGDKAAALDAALARFQRDAASVSSISRNSDITAHNNSQLSVPPLTAAPNTTAVLPSIPTSVNTSLTIPVGSPPQPDYVPPTTSVGPHPQPECVPPIEPVSSPPQPESVAPKTVTPEKPVPDKHDKSRPISPPSPEVEKIMHGIRFEKYRGKCLSCLEHDRRQGRYALVEAISKLYFPDVNLNELQFWMENVLRLPSVTCTSEEEKAFVIYYGLPVPFLKCNKMVEVGTLDKYFPQLLYMHSSKTSGNKPDSPLLPLTENTSIVPGGPIVPVTTSNVSTVTSTELTNNVRNNNSESSENLPEAQTLTNSSNPRKRKQSFDQDSLHASQGELSLVSKQPSPVLQNNNNILTASNEAVIEIDC